MEEITYGTPICSVSGCKEWSTNIVDTKPFCLTHRVEEVKPWITDLIPKQELTQLVSELEEEKDRDFVELMEETIDVESYQQGIDQAIQTIKDRFNLP